MLVIPPDVSPRLRYTSLITTTQISSPSCSEQVIERRFTRGAEVHG